MIRCITDTTWVRESFPDARAVYLLGPFNRWSTTATPMRRDADGEWIAELPQHSAYNLTFFVWYAGDRCGRLMRGGVPGA